MEKVVLNASKRDVIGKQVRALRREGKLPAVIYGRHTEPIKINLDAHSAALVLGKLTSSSLVTINLDGTEYPALVREKQRDFIKNRLLHVDFLAVSMSEKLRSSHCRASCSSNWMPGEYVCSSRLNAGNQP